MEINVKDLAQQPSVKLIELKGELDILGSKKLSDKLSLLIEAGHFCLIVDLHNLTYINSTGIYSLLSFFNKVKDKGGFLKLFAANERIKEILDVIGVNKLIPLYNTLQEALTDKK